MPADRLNEQHIGWAHHPCTETVVLQTGCPLLGPGQESPFSLLCPLSTLGRGLFPNPVQPTSLIPWSLTDGHIHGAWPVPAAAMLLSQRLSQVSVLSSKKHKRARLWPAPEPAEVQLTLSVTLLTDKIRLKRQLMEKKEELLFGSSIKGLARHGMKVVA